jgi:mannose-6-phosphate isomerase-like protein (cupin superfamily)
MINFVEKPWGGEVWLEKNEHYCVKKLYLNPGQELSLQYHNEKCETMTVLTGMGELVMGPPGKAESFTKVSHKPITEGNTFTLPPKTLHKIRALTGLIILEISTPQTEDLVRVEDRYGRD